jgi:SET domain
MNHNITVKYGKGFELATPFTQKIEALQDALLEMPQANIVTTHTFKPGIYERAITIPAWTVLTGAEHKTDYKIRLEKGTIAVNVGDKVKIMTAPCEFEAKAGVQRVGRVFEEEVIWVDIYDNPDNCKDIATLEKRLYVVPACGLGENRVALSIKNAQNDYNVFISQLGLSQDQIDEMVQIENDLIDMPKGYAVELRDSKIHGKGLFAIKRFEAGEIVCPGRIDGKRTPAGRFINHSFECNVVPTLVGDDINAVATRTIHAGEELLVDYRASMRINFGIALQGELPCQVG